MADSILERWDITPEELTEVVDQNPSLRGMILGYLAELKLERLWLSGVLTEAVKKIIYQMAEAACRSETLSTVRLCDLPPLSIMTPLKPSTATTG